MANRVELVYADDDPAWDRIEAARGLVPRATWIKAMVEAMLPDDTPRPSPAGRQAKTEVAKTPARPAATARQGASRPAASPRPCPECGALGGHQRGCTRR